jgi:hypothetical protein
MTAVAPAAISAVRGVTSSRNVLNREWNEGVTADTTFTRPARETARPSNRAIRRGFIGQRLSRREPSRNASQEALLV